MEKTSAHFLIAAINLMEQKLSSYCPLSLMDIITWWTILSTLYGLSTRLCCLLHTTLHSLSTTTTKPNSAIGTLNNANNATVTPSKPNCDKLLRGEVEVVMGRLGIMYDPNGDEVGEGLGKDEIEGLLEEEGMGLEEVREAFGVFDENCDGFIDANELEKVVCALGFKEVSQDKCQRMIATFDENGDGKIDLGEFVKLLENSSLLGN
ncbi:Calcium-binding protein CML30 [Actinidia chinensis var. chinensis]|uniref:Calcium-binding protein CML30 n=1 Tax=Actinidia chinensis var. chinensis TaxID=1590841 RepID=A0A2R6PE39_ACTCC|nr:Calcium-binding protein CML30 [Actinidia chinensis var. chinensis]